MFHEKNFQICKKKKKKNSEVFFQITITFFGAIRRQCEENKKDAPKLQLSKSVLRFFRTFLEQ
jgi:hypothetical protein